MSDAGIRVQGQLTAVRPAVEKDADLLVRWHADREVARYWDDETFTHAEMIERLRRPDVEALVIEEGTSPVGYLQVWGTAHEGGLDLFLIPEARGRGLGPDAARAVAHHLRRERGWSRITVDPYVWNEAAVHAWRRAGFRGIEEREPDSDHAARWLLMEFEG